MTRKEFVKVCGLLGLNMSFFGAMASKNEKPLFSGKVIIIGAGAAGLTAGYLLRKQGIDFSILEASAVCGGRMQTNNTFTDFPISLGAEWITSDNIHFNQLISSQELENKIVTKGYTQNDEYAVWHNRKLVIGHLDRLNYKKFINSSWLDFFKEFIIPSVKKYILYEHPVTAVDYSTDTISVNTQQDKFIADKVLITTPLPILKSKKITFTPTLPKKKLDAFNEVKVWDGFKAFISFKEKFYPTFVDFIIHPETDGQISYYDAAFGQTSHQHILGLFAVGKPAKTYGEFNENDLKKYLLDELDEIFDGQASANYLQHTSKHWSKEPYIGCAYISDFSAPKAVKSLQKPIDNKLFFAGDGYTQGRDWGNVHNAINSAKHSVHQMLKEQK